MYLDINEQSVEQNPELKHMGLVRTIANYLYSRYKTACDIHGVTVDDLVQAGYPALKKGVADYNESFKVTIGTYLSKCLFLEMRDSIRKAALVKLPRYIYNEALNKVNGKKFSKAFQERFDRNGNLEDLVEKGTKILNMGRMTLSDVAEKMYTRSELDKNSDANNVYNDDEKQKLREKMEKLPTRQREAITMYYEGKSFREIGAANNYSHQTASDLIKAGVRSLKQMMGANDEA